MKVKSAKGNESTGENIEPITAMEVRDDLFYRRRRPQARRNYVRKRGLTFREQQENWFNALSLIVT